MVAPTSCGKVADLRLVAPEHRARIEREILLGQAGIIRQQALEQRGFARAVAAHQADLFAAQNVGGKAIDDLQFAVILASDA